MRKGFALDLAQPGKMSAEPLGKWWMERTEQVRLAGWDSCAPCPGPLIGPWLRRGLRLARYHRNLRVFYRGATLECEGIEEHTRSCDANSSALHRTPPRERLQ